MIDEMHKKYVGGVDRQKDRNKQIDEQNYRQLANRQIYIQLEKERIIEIATELKREGRKKGKRKRKLRRKTIDLSTNAHPRSTQLSR